ncbi:opioid growth factor receptor-like isoform X2 [Mytilus trossulus]|uniref:opioid growth factor receptor-like isoform X2 n=1 Tax=Mytilus trossulus TaxID=6551 RepID=UPI00300479EE
MVPRILIINICLLLVLLLVVDLSECRGGRGGGRFGGSRFSRSTRTRYSRSSRYRSARFAVARTKYSSHRLSSPSLKQAAIIGGTVYGARLWMRRSTYRSRHTYPEVCYNDVYEGNTTQRYYGRFVCPAYGDPDDFAYCCGDIGIQTCCKFFDTSSPQGAGRTAGVVIGVLIAVGIVGVLAYCCFKRRKSSQGAILSTNESAKPLQPMPDYSSPPMPTTMPYGVQPSANGGPPPHPPSYGDAMNNPYPAEPCSDPWYKPPMPTDDVNTGGNVPYGINPEPAPGYGPDSNMPYSYPPAPEGETPYPGPTGGAAPYPSPTPAGGFVAPYPSAPADAAYPSAPADAAYPPPAGAAYPPPAGGNNYPQ